MEGNVAANGSTNGKQHAQEEAERRERERAQNMEIPPSDRAAGIALVDSLPADQRPVASGTVTPNPTQLKSIATVQEAMKARNENGGSLPQLYLGSEND